MTNKTVVVGGGLAGLAATVALASRGFEVTLLESRPRLGGRASSFQDQTTDSLIDNCQHVTMGCCTNFQHFCETVGIDGYLERQSTLYFVAPDGTINPFSAGRLPPPFHLAASFYRLSYFSLRDLRTIAGGLRALLKSRTNDECQLSFLAWLQNHRQPKHVIDNFWQVVLVSTLSEDLNRIDVGYARKVFADGFILNRRGWEVTIPRVPLESLYGTILQDWLNRQGVTTRLKSSVQQLNVTGDRIDSALLKSGETVAADDWIVATPYHRIAALLPDSCQQIPELKQVQQLTSAPISSVHLWFDRPLTDLPHAAIVGKLSQWMFNRSAIQNVHQTTADQRAAADVDRTNGDNFRDCFYYQIVISASRGLKTLSSEDIIRKVVGELFEIWPGEPAPRLMHSRLVTEHQAVFSPSPGVDRFRPLQQSTFANLQWAGDWTQTGWPATMEGAIRSGFLAVENVLQRHGTTERILQPDLQPGWLARSIF